MVAEGIRLATAASTPAAKDRLTRAVTTGTQTLVTNTVGTSISNSQHCVSCCKTSARNDPMFADKT